MHTGTWKERYGINKLTAIIFAISFVSTAGLGLVAVMNSNRSVSEVTAKTFGTMDPGGLPHYFGPYGNYANSPVPTGPVIGIVVDSGGSGYSSPVVDISDVWGTGSGATATATTSGGVITSIVIGSEGTGYSAPIVTITDSTGSGAAATATIGGTLSGGIRKFVDSLPGLGANDANNLGNYISIAVPDTVTYPGCDYYEIAVVRYEQKMHSDLPATLLNGYVQLETSANAAFSKHILLFNPDGSPILRANGTQAVAVDNPNYLGPTIVATRDIPTRVTFHNLLPIGSAGNLFIPVDTTVMGSGMGPTDMVGMPGMKENYTENRATLHLHGGATPWISDGTPHQWTTPSGENTQYPKGVSVQYVPDMWFVNGSAVPNTVGVTVQPVPGATTNPGNGSLTFYYTNQQSARLMFYHDHSYGITRLNVYSGEAAGYLLTDSVENDLVKSGVVPGLAGEYLYGIPLVIQDKTFVDASTIAYQDPTWAWGSTPVVPHTGDLWAPHVYMPNQNPYDVSGANPYGRWDYGPWFFPPPDIMHGPVANPYYDPINAPWEPPMIPGVPKVSATMEAFMDTPVVNGEAYPYLSVEPQSYRFRILNAANDRFFNLQMYVADPNVVTSDGRHNTEVNMVPAISTPGFPAGWPSDGRVGGVPNPAYMGPSWVQIGTEGGFLPAPVVIPNQPVTWNYNMKTFNFGNVQNHSLLLGTAERADVIVDFSQFAGKTIIVYNDAPAGFPAYDPRSDYYTGDLDNTGSGGAPTTQPGYGPNTRTVMQIRVASHTPAPRFDLSALNAAFATTPGHLGVFAQSQPPILVPQAKYDSAYGMSFPADAFVRIQDTSMTFTTLDSTVLTIPFQPKAIHDEMGGSYDVEYGRMSGTLGLEVPSGNAVTQMFIPLGYASPPVDIVNVSMTAISPVLGDGTQIWKITHNGVDTHAMHWHMYNVQLINRVAWDNTLMVPDDNELGWKETVRVDPLSDTIIALRPVVLSLPWEVPSSIREIDPTLPDGAPLLPPPGGFNDPNANPVTVTNHLVNYGWEYVLHCHLLEHEEMDMMHAMPVAVPPYAPVNLTATLSGTAVNLTWTDNSIAETGYWIQRSAVSVPWTTIGNLTSSLYTIGPTKGSLMHYNDTVVSDGTVYSYRVLAITTIGDTFDYGGGAGYPSSTVNSTPSNTIDANTGTGNVTVHSLPVSPPWAPTPPAAPRLFTYVPPTAVLAPAPSGSTSYSTHAPIRIDSNTDFDVGHGVTSGAGTALSPWVIENLRINGTGFGYGIYIGNTTDHFIVRNNYIESASGGTFRWNYSPDSGIVLNDVVNGAVAYNALYLNAWSGVYMLGSQHVLLFNNTISNNYMGVYLQSSSNNTISSNNISDSEAGIWLYDSDSNAVSRNTLTRNQPAMVLMGSYGATITNNSVYANSYYGLWLHASAYGYIHDNDFVMNHGSTFTHNASHVQAFDDSTTNRWNTTSRGNHWSDWTTPDANHNGIVDVAYSLDGGAGATDHYPIVAPLIPDLLTTVVVTPSPVDVILHSVRAFSAQGLSQYGSPMTGLSFAWSTSVGVMTGNSLSAQAAVGTVGYVRATSGVVSGDAVVHIVLGPLARINVTPAATSVVSGGYQLFTAAGMDAYYNLLSRLTFNWTTNVGTITSYGLFTAQTTFGVTGFVNASVGGVTGSSVVTILHVPLTHIVVTPAFANIAAGAVQSFAAVGYDMFGDVIPGLTFSWTTTVGTMTGSNFTAQTTSGVMGVVNATNGFVTGYALVTIVPGPLNHIDVAPTPVTTVAGSQMQFTAAGKDVHNNVITGLTFSWTTNVGAIDASGLFTAQLAGGVGYVNASSGLVTGSASVSVVVINTPPIIIPLVNITCDAGEVISVSGVAVDADHDPIRYTWDFGDGTPLVIGQSTTHAYSIPGNYTLVLYADDLTGLVGHNVSSSATVTVRVVLPNGTGFVHGYVFLDRYTPGIMGVKDTGESGLGNWEISLAGRTSGGSLVGVTNYSNNFNAVGYYEFRGIAPGMYWVNLTLLSGYYASTPVHNQVGVPTGLVDPLDVPRDYGIIVQSPDQQVPFLLKQGWNLWSTPATVNNLTAMSLLTAIGSSGLIVVKHDSVANKYVSYVVGDPVQFDFPIIVGEGYYLWAQSPVHFTLLGVMPSNTSVQLENGWNLIGYSGLGTITASHLLSLVQNSSGYIVVSSDPSTGKYQSFVSGDPAKFDFDVTPGRAYYVWSIGSGTIIYP